MWPKVQQARDEKRYELVLVGDDINEKIEKEGQLDPATYDLTLLNFLRVSGSPLVSLSEDIGKLVNMTNLVLQGNKLQSLPESIGRLEKLKLLDVSMNCLESLPSGISKLTKLASLNANNNNLQSVPNLEACIHLAVLDLRENEITEFPQVFNENLTQFLELRLGNNELRELPSSLTILPAIKIVDVTDNKIKVVPGELIDCPKLKELNLKGNPLTDRRLKKLVEADRCIPRQVLDYVKQHCPRTSVPQGGKAGGGKGKKGKGKGKNKEKDEVDDLCDELHVLAMGEKSPVVVVESSVKTVRPYIVCCVLHALNLAGENIKKFIAVQTKLHEGVCQKRLSATIATHDLAKITSPLRYLAKAPEDILIHPLTRGKEVTATELYQGLQQEAEAQRKHQKRNNVTGIHKFLHLVEKWNVWPCLVDASGTVASLPPITNSDNTKISSTTSDVFVEVTSGESLAKAKEVMNAVILSIFSCGLTTEENANTENTNTQTVENAVLKVGQVRVEDEDGALRVLYPSRVDFAEVTENIRVVMPAK